jgi:DNA-binding SARP family transcriptional activator/TolB-like protein
VDVGVGMRVESSSGVIALPNSALSIQLLGPITVLQHETPIALPASRKARALLAYLACAQRPVSRTHLCELLWDVPNDPRGELRWCLSRLRSVINSEDYERISTVGDTIALNLSDCELDVTSVTQAIQGNLSDLPVEELHRLHEKFRGEFAEGLEIDRNPEFAVWLGAQRRCYRDMHIAVLKLLVSRVDNETPRSRQCIESWLQLAPFDLHPHQALLTNLSRSGRAQEGDEHLAATIRRFETEGLDWLRLREFWRSTRSSPPNRHVASANRGVDTPTEAEIAQEVISPTRRASVCVMPFVDRTGVGKRSTLAEGLTEDIITRLAKLRVLFVIARGSVFALGERNIAPEEAGRLLNVDYVVSGSIRRHGRSFTFSVELAEARTSRVIWVDELTSSAQEVFVVHADIANRIVASISKEIESAERDRAVLKPPNSLDAWEAYHCGLWHMYRFSAADNAQAAEFFKRALRQDRTFARAHAGLSFTHFQNAFLHRLAEREVEIERAYVAAADGLSADDRDPAAHWAMGRALWLRGLQDQSLLELEECVSLSPNFALGHYTLAFVHGQSGDPRVAIASSEWSRKLSPFDPLLFAMLCARALGHFRLGDYEDAAHWAAKGAARRNAHVHIKVIAASCLSAAGRVPEARELVASVRKTSPSYRLDDFLTAFRFSPDAEQQFRQSAARVGLA